MSPTHRVEAAAVFEDGRVGRHAVRQHQQVRQRVQRQRVVVLPVHRLALERHWAQVRLLQQGHDQLPKHFVRCVLACTCEQTFRELYL